MSRGSKGCMSHHEKPLLGLRLSSDCCTQDRLIEGRMKTYLSKFFSSDDIVVVCVKLLEERLQGQDTI